LKFWCWARQSPRTRNLSDFSAGQVGTGGAILGGSSPLLGTYGIFLKNKNLEEIYFSETKQKRNFYVVFVLKIIFFSARIFSAEKILRARAVALASHFRTLFSKFSCTVL